VNLTRKRLWMRCCRRRWVSEMSRRWRRLLIAFALLAVLAASLPWLLPPERIADLVLRQIGPGLQLDITRSGKAAWRVRGEPMLEVHGLDIRKTGADTPWLTAERIMLAVPWQTLRNTGKALEITRIELDSATFNIPAFRHWLDSRVADDADIAWPLIHNGLALENGQLQGDGWQIAAIDLQVPHVMPDAPVRGKLSFQYAAEAAQADIDLNLAMTRPALPAGAAIVGTIHLASDGTRIPATFTLSAPLRLQDGQWQIPALKLALAGELATPDAAPLPFSIALSGTPGFDDAIALSPLALELTGSGALPSLTATGHAVFAENLSIVLSGTLPRWPAAWPTLPAPLNRRGDFGFSLDYRGATDFSGVSTLQLQRGQTRLDATLRPSVLADWRSGAPSSPLPPLQSRLSTPSVELPGVTLSGLVMTSEP